MADQQPMKPESLFEMRWVSDPQLAPDGERVAYVEHWVEEIEKNGERRPAYRTAIYLSAEADQSPRRLTYAPTGSDSMPRWSPDGRALAFVSTRDGEVAQLWILDLDGGEAQPVTTTARLSEGVSAFDWHPSGTMFCILTAGHKDEDAKRRDALHDEKVYENRLPIKFDNVGFYKPDREQLYRIGRDGSGYCAADVESRRSRDRVCIADGRDAGVELYERSVCGWH
jgi:dipeptidyl aminopeptidase/acylaminoacyl peptidase